MTTFVFSSTLAKKPVFNHTNKTITVSDKFMTEAAKPFTNEFNDLMELLNFPFAFPTTDFCMMDSNSKFGKRCLNLFCDILGSIIKVTGIKLSISQNRLLQSIFDDVFFLIIIKTRR